MTTFGSFSNSPVLTLDSICCHDTFPNRTEKNLGSLVKRQFWKNGHRGQERKWAKWLFTCCFPPSSILCKRPFPIYSNSQRCREPMMRNPYLPVLTDTVHCDTSAARPHRYLLLDLKPWSPHRLSLCAIPTVQCQRNAFCPLPICARDTTIPAESARGMHVLWEALEKKCDSKSSQSQLFWDKNYCGHSECAHTDLHYFFLPSVSKAKLDPSRFKVRFLSAWKFLRDSPQEVSTSFIWATVAPRVPPVLMLDWALLLGAISSNLSRIYLRWWVTCQWL